MKLTMGSRGSALAQTQTRWVADELKKAHPALEIDFVTITTTGDTTLTPHLQASGGKGVFVKEIEDALLRREIDIAVHSLKDMPPTMPLGLRLGPTPLREDPRDAVISRFGELLQELPKGSTVGTSSPRRRAQIKNLYKSRRYTVEPLRGNVDTRIRKLHNGDYDSIVVAAAGVKRLGLASELSEILDPNVFLPAPCQGCLAVQFREKETSHAQLLEALLHPASDITARAERAFLQGVGGDCYVALGVWSDIQDDKLLMKAVVLDAEGERRAHVQWSGPADQPEWVGGQLSEWLLAEGGSDILFSQGTPPASAPQ